MEYKSNLDLQINNSSLLIATHPKVRGLTLDPKLTYSIHIPNILVQPTTNDKSTHRTRGWGTQKETLMATYKAVMRPPLEYTSSIWSRIVSSTSINKTARHAERSIEDCHRMHPRHKHTTSALRKHSHFPYTSTYSSTRHDTNRKHNIHHNPLHKHIPYFNTPRPLHNTHSHRPHTVTTTDIKTNMRHIHTSIVSRNLSSRGNNTILCTPPPHISISEDILPASLVVPLTYLEQINHLSSNHTNTKSTPKYIHHHYISFVTLTHTTHIISLYAPTFAPHSPSGLWTDPAPFVLHMCAYGGVV